MEINFLFFLTVVPAIILYGIAKSGLGGSMTLISVPLMTIVMPLNQALGIILPILIFSDFIAVYKYRKEFDLGTLKLMVPFAAASCLLVITFFLKKIKKKNQKKTFLKVVLVQSWQDLQVFAYMQEEPQLVFIYSHLE